MSVPIKLTRWAVRPSGDAKKPVTLALIYDGVGKDHPIEGIELDLSKSDVLLLTQALNYFGRTP